MSGKVSKGFTLLELMIVVIILGVLAAIAVPTFQSQLHQSKSAEAQALLRDIAAKQDAYRAEFGQFLNVSGSFSYANRRPVNAPRGDFGFLGWVGGGDPIYTAWNQLGFRPQSAVRFGYVVVAGLPGTDPSSLGVPAGFAGDANDHWWAAAAWGNPNAGGNPSDTPAEGQCSQFLLSSKVNIMTVLRGTP
ncbi:MAG: prepilin-type N-terminal cleavage/methylation domain-containing protein [Deltaproteobacteria bacterium]|nr:prepilin-type N-terminal cleavage/methylation domain-containing protein [Deltaproteobacteria bacterium]